MIKITKDWHLGFKRTAGVTVASKEALRTRLLEAFREQLDPAHPHLIAGDLFDQFTVDTRDIIDTYHILFEFLATGQELALVRGNHDFSIRGEAKSSFDLLATLLEAQFPRQVTIAREVTRWGNFVLIPHLPNNEILQIEVDKLKDETRTLVFHANYDNFHAADSEHSLNVTPEMVENLKSPLILFGHEHAHRKIGNRIVCLGNAFPTSIADCLGGPKFAWMYNGETVTPVEIWNPKDEFDIVDWTELDDVGDDLKFIRVGGDATAAQAADAVGSVAKLRLRHDAYVITNAVRVEGVGDAVEMQSLEQVKQFDVLSALLSKLDEREGEVVRALLND
jgi:metallophosphoesterase superfamily enzyme